MINFPDEDHHKTFLHGLTTKNGNNISYSMHNNYYENSKSIFMQIHVPNLHFFMIVYHTYALFMLSTGLDSQWVITYKLSDNSFLLSKHEYD